MAPNDFFQKGDDPIILSNTKDHNFALSGEIMLMVVVLLFTLFLLTLICFLCMRHYLRYSSCIPSDQMVQSPNYPSTPMTIKPLHRDIVEYDRTRWMS